MKPVPTLEQYQDVFGWRIQIYGGGTFLSLGAGMVGVAILNPLSSLVAARLRRQSIRGPILAINQHPHRWVFLADSDDEGITTEDLPLGVELLTCPKRLPLPSTLHGPVHWVVSPLPLSWWLPGLAAIVAAASNAMHEPPKEPARRSRRPAFPHRVRTRF